MAQNIFENIPHDLREFTREWIGFIPVFEKDLWGELKIIEVGTRHEVCFDPRDLLELILINRPSGIYLIHNHPSGDLNPSKEDFLLTSQVEELLNLIGMKLKGHWIVTASSQNSVTKIP